VRDHERRLYIMQD